MNVHVHVNANRCVYVYVYVGLNTFTHALKQKKKHTWKSAPASSQSGVIPVTHKGALPLPQPGSRNACVLKQGKKGYQVTYGFPWAEVAFLSRINCNLLYNTKPNATIK